METGPKGRAGNRLGRMTGTGGSVRAGQDECRMDLIVRHKQIQHCQYYQYREPGSLVPTPFLF